MSSPDREVAGQRIARARRRRGLSQTVLAGLVGRSESWLSQVERGKRGIDSHSVLERLADVLRVHIKELTGSGDGDEPGRRVHPAASLIEQAMMAYGAPGASAEREEPDREVSLDYLHAKARSAYQSYQATRYDTTGRILPGLIRGAETAARSVGAASPVASGVRVLVYDTTAALLNRVGEPFLAWAAADRARSAAEYAGDPLLAAVSAWRLSYMITGRKHPQEALGLAITAAAALERAMRAPSPEQLSVYGALHLAAATAAAPTGTSRGRDLTRTFVRVPRPHPRLCPLPSRRYGASSPVLPSLVAGQDPANARRGEVEERVTRSLRLVPDEWDQLWRLGQFRQRHPGVVIGSGEGWWQAWIPEPNGEIVTTRYTLRALLDKLDELLGDNPGNASGQA